MRFSYNDQYGGTFHKLESTFKEIFGNSGNNPMEVVQESEEKLIEASTITQTNCIGLRDE